MSDPLTAVWRVLLRDASGAIYDELDNWISLTARRVFNGVGTFELEISSDGVSARFVNEACGIMITRNGEIVFSGQIRTEFTRTANTIRCGGLDDNYLLTRPALPDPAGPPYTSPYDVVTAAHASTVMIAYVYNNASLGARVDRRVGNLAFASDPLLGGSYTGRAGGEPVLAVLQNCAVSASAGGLGFEILQSDSAGTRLFRIYQPQDRSADVKFGLELGTASDFEDVKSAPAFTYAYVMGGDGLGFDQRTIAEGGDAGLIAQWGQIETLIDARGITSPAELNVKLAEVLAGATASRKISVSPIEVPSQQFYDDWNLGDLVTVQVVSGFDAETFVDLIREIRIDMTTDRGVIVTPTIGEAGATNDSLTAQYITSVQDRLSNIERNWTVPDLSIIPAMLADNAVITRAIADHAVTAAKLDAIDSPANNEVAAFDSATGRLKWFSFSELAGNLATLVNLTVTGNTILGDNAAADTLVVNAVEVHNGAAGFAGAVNVAGAATLAGVTATSLSVSGATALAALTASSAAISGAVTAASAAISGTESANKLVLNGTTFAGAEVLHVISGSSVFDGKLTVTVSGLDVTGASIFRNAVSFTSGGVDVSGGFIVNSGGADVTGSSTFHNSVTVSAGGIGVTGSSAFNSGLSVASGFALTSGNFTLPNTSIGFFGSAIAGKQTVSGSRSANAALASLLSALANYGLLTDSSTI